MSRRSLHCFKMGGTAEIADSFVPIDETNVCQLFLILEVHSSNE
jgi:hypothetical protein